MEKNILSRREFFRDSFKKVIPILAATALLSKPLLLSASNEYSACNGSCTGTCAGTCEGLCAKGCTAACRGNCEGSCEGTCKGTCQGGCYTTCSGK